MATDYTADEGAAVDVGFDPGRALSLHTERADASQTHLGRANY